MESLKNKNYSVCALYSGSKGNCVLIRSEGARILIDAGKSARALGSALESIGEDISKIDAIFITHEHTDHVSALAVMLKKYKIPVHAVEATARKMLCGPLKSHEDCLCIHTPIFSVEVGDMRISSFPTSHDSEFSVGYKICVTKDGVTDNIGYATDLGYVSDSVRGALLGCETVVLESNHDLDMLMGGTYPYELKIRIASDRGHLSNKACADFAAELCASGTKNILLAHLSEENNRPDVAYDTVWSSLADEGINLKIASAYECVFLV